MLSKCIFNNQSEEHVSLLAREPDGEEVVVDDVARWGTINQILVKQYVEGRLDAAGARKVVTLDKLITLRTGQTAFFGDGFHQRLLIVCKEIYQFFVLHGTLIDNMKDSLVDLCFTDDMLLGLV